MSFYLPNPAVRPTGQEAAEYVDTVPPEYPAVVDPAIDDRSLTTQLMRVQNVAVPRAGFGADEG